MNGQNDYSEKVPWTVKDTHGYPYEPLFTWAPEPRRRPIGQVPGRRRPVVAILDTGVSEHPWFDSSAEDPNLINATTWEWPADPNGGLAKPRHGTFVAGLIRQNAPDATILSVALHRQAFGKTVDGKSVKDGIATGQIEEALKWVADRPHDRFVDVICLAVGFPLVTDDNADYLDKVRVAIEAVGRRGSLVVAAAGNVGFGDDDHLYPAALLADHSGDKLSLVAVGAVDADNEWADFSVSGEWVDRKYVGVNVLSTTPGHCGFSKFGRGSGTSYSAAGFAGLVAQAMLDNDAGVVDVEPAAATERVRRALKAVGWRV